MKPEPLTFSPQASKAIPASLMFFAALMSRSCVTEHDGQSHVRISSDKSRDQGSSTISLVEETAYQKD